jgi:ribonucleoside-triphosphate reductase (formate)
MAKCGMKCEVFSRVVGYMRPVAQWNKGKKEEFKDRVEYDESACMCSRMGTRGYPTPEIEKATM